MQYKQPTSEIHTRTTGVEDLFRVRKNLRLHHKILFIALVFVGLTCCWYGVWTAIASIPVVSNPIVAMLIGILLLLVTGKINDLK